METIKKKNLCVCKIYQKKTATKKLYKHLLNKIAGE